MKYFLVIGLNYQRYKEPAKVHVSSGDRLLDSFELTDTSLDVFLKQDQMHYEFLQKYKKDLTGLAAPQYYRVYKVDDAEIRDNFSIKFYNSNSNYTNGFMSKSALVQCKHIALFPEYMTKNNCEPLYITLDRLTEAWEMIDKRYEKNEKFFGNPKDLHGENGKIIPKDKVLEDHDIPHATWPGLHWLKIKPLKDAFVESGLYPSEYWIGGDFEISINVKEKYGVKYLHTEGTRTHGAWNYDNTLFFIAVSKNLLNIYNEDNRSNI